MPLACSSTCLRGKTCVFLCTSYYQHINVYCFYVRLYARVCVCVFVFAALRVCVYICMLGGGWGLLWTENIPPSRNLHDPAASLPTAICFFTPHTASATPHPPPPPPITQTRTRSPHSPCKPPLGCWGKSREIQGLQGEGE